MTYSPFVRVRGITQSWKRGGWSENYPPGTRLNRPPKPPELTKTALHLDLASARKISPLVYDGVLAMVQ